MSEGWVAVGFVVAAVPALVVFLVRAQVLSGVAGALLLAAATFTDVRALAAAVVLAAATALACGRFSSLVQAQMPPAGTRPVQPADPGTAERGLAPAMVLLVLFPAVATAGGVWFTAWHDGR